MLETTPKDGRMRMYTSGWPKNQKMCWNSTGSPPPAALKKLVPKNLSVSSMVTPPASTGMTAISRKAVISQVQTNSGIFIRVMPGARMLRMVVITLIAPMIEDMPIRWMAKITNGRASPVCSVSGGYRVQPPAGPPPSMNMVDSSMLKANGRIQKLQLFMRGSAMSVAPIISGICQLARPVNAGMTTPKIITSACSVVMELKNCGSTNCSPGANSSVRITSAMAPPMKNISSASHRYSVPMSLWLVVTTQRHRPPGWCSSCACASAAAGALMRRLRSARRRPRPAVRPRRGTRRAAGRAPRSA